MLDMIGLSNQRGNDYKTSIIEQQRTQALSRAGSGGAARFVADDHD
jgi:hypothetical protein